MADDEKKESQTPPDGAAGVPAGGGGGKLVGLVLPAVLAGLAAFGGAKLGGGGGAAAGHGAEATGHDEKKMPGFTVELKAFVLMVTDEVTKENKPLKLSLAIELEKLAKKEEFEPFVPRVRDTVNEYIRGLSYQEIMNPRTKERMTEDLLERIHKLGGESAKRVLVQEMVTQ